MTIHKFALPKNWDWLLFASIAFYIIVPSIYNSYSVFLIGNTPPNENNLEIVAQWQFVQVLFEVVQEALVFPIFYFVGSQISSNKEVILERVKTSLAALLVILLPIFLITYFGIDYFIDAIGTAEQIVSETNTYLSIKIWALLFSILNIGLVIIIESLKFKRTLFFLVFIKLILFVSLDSLFFGGYSFSLEMGIIGVAISNLLVECLIFIFLLTGIFRSFNISIVQFLKIPSFKNLRLFNQIGLGIGIESLIKNVAYFIMILKMLNSIGSKEIGGYYLAMHLYWSFFSPADFYNFRYFESADCQ
jgi:Na+-driven multidrug efflux pump